LPKENQQILASKYQTVLPSKEELKERNMNKMIKVHGRATFT